MAKRSISDFTQGLRDQEPTLKKLPEGDLEILPDGTVVVESEKVVETVVEPIAAAVSAGEPIVIPPDHPDYEFLKNRPQAGATAYGCVMVDEKMFAKLYYGCIQGQTMAFTGQAAIRFFAEMLGVVNGNREAHLKMWKKYKEVFNKR